MMNSSLQNSGSTDDDPPLKHLFDGGVFNVYSTEVDNLSVGAPGPDLLRGCVDIFKKATDHRMGKEEGHSFLFQYGIPCGSWEFRQKLAEFLSDRYGDVVNRQDLVLTCGASHGLQLIVGSFLPPDAIIFVEEVTYMIALSAFKQFPMMKVVPVPFSRDGIDATSFFEIASSMRATRGWDTSEERPFWAVLYTIPHFHNPTGVTSSVSCCQSVVKIARQLNILVACDDVYNLLFYGEGKYPPKRMFYHDVNMEGYSGGHVISNGTFSKIMAPGIRVGWLECPPRLTKLLRQSGVLLSGGAVNHYTSGIITSALELGYVEEQLNLLISTFKERMTALCDTFTKFLPKECTFHRPEGGYFVWVVLPENINAADFAEWCRNKHKVSVIPGNTFSPEGKFKNCFRVGIAFHDTKRLSKAGEVLCKALTEYQSFLPPVI